MEQPIPSTIFHFDNVKASDSFQTWFDNFSWWVKPGETWCVLGGNGSGKTLLAALLRGELPISSGEFQASWWTGERTEGTLPSLISFEALKSILDFERWNDDSEFLEGGIDPGRSVARFVGDHNPWVQSLGLPGLLDRGLKFLSSGELRRALLARELHTCPPLLILDEPYEALDQEARGILQNLWITLKVPQIFFLQRLEDIPAHATHFLILQDRDIIRSGPRESYNPEELESLMNPQGGDLENLPPIPQDTEPLPDTLVDMRNITVNYGDKVVLDGFTWSVRPGDHWLITGPNGAGKSTLLSLITGDNVQAHREKVFLFGQHRSAQTLWELRRRQGVVSASLHQAHDHNLDQPLWAIVAGGLFDTIGLYETLGWERKEFIQLWLKAFGMNDYAHLPFPHLSYGLQRLALLLRALVKEPPLLILDEPCQGLDTHHTHMFLNAVDKIAKENRSTILYVTHRQEEKLQCLKNHLQFEKTEQGTYFPKIRALP